MHFVRPSSLIRLRQRQTSAASCSSSTNVPVSHCSASLLTRALQRFSIEIILDDTPCSRPSIQLEISVSKESSFRQLTSSRVVDFDERISSVFGSDRIRPADPAGRPASVLFWRRLPVPVSFQSTWSGQRQTRNENAKAAVPCCFCFHSAFSLALCLTARLGRHWQSAIVNSPRISIFNGCQCGTLRCVQ